MEISLPPSTGGSGVERSAGNAGSTCVCTGLEYVGDDELSDPFSGGQASADGMGVG